MTVEIQFDCSAKRFIGRYFRRESLWETRSVKPYERRRLVIAAKLAEGQKIRVPWSEIEKGRVWTAEIVLEDYVFERKAKAIHRKSIEGINQGYDKPLE